MDEVDIANLVYRCAELLDRGELAKAVDLFAEAEVVVDGNLLDRDELVALWQQESVCYPDGAPRVRHLINNPIVEVNRHKGTATCRSNLTVLEAKSSLPFQVIASGTYEDEFVRVDGHWRFSARVCTQFGKAKEASAQTVARTGQRKRSEHSLVQARIIAAAQQIFSTVGYSEAGMRKIADMVGVAPTILFRQFGTKASLFEAALIDAMGDPKLPVEKQSFGRHVASLLADPNQINSPHAMTVLATGNEEAREIAIRVLREYAIDPMIEWLGEPYAESRAHEIMALCAGFALYNSQLNIKQSKQVDPHMVEWLVHSVQAVVDQTE